MQATTVIVLSLMLSMTYAKYNYRFLKIDCNTSKISVINDKCYIKSFDRRKPLANMEFYVLRKLPDLKVKINILLIFYLFLTHFQLLLEVSYKMESTGDYHKFLSLENIEFCKVLNGAKALQLLKMGIDALTSVIDISLLCTSTGQINFNNWTYPDSPVSCSVLKLFHENLEIFQILLLCLLLYI
jgi:hypothetical protein